MGTLKKENKDVLLPWSFPVPRVLNHCDSVWREYGQLLIPSSHLHVWETLGTDCTAELPACTLWNMKIYIEYMQKYLACWNSHALSWLSWWFLTPRLQNCQLAAQFFCGSDAHHQHPWNCTSQQLPAQCYGKAAPLPSCLCCVGERVTRKWRT